MSDFKVQRGLATIPGGGSTVVITAGVDYDAPVGVAFIRLTSTQDAGQIVGTRTREGRYTTAWISNPSNLAASITFQRFEAHANALNCAWEIIEYVGASGGDNEFKVRHVEALNLASTVASADSGAVGGVADNSDVVVFRTSQACFRTASAHGAALNHAAEWVSASQLARVTRNDSVQESNASIAVVEFTGVNWKVQRATHAFVASGVTETESITAVGSLSKAFLEIQLRTANGNLDESGQEAWLSATDTISFHLESGATVAHDAVVWVIENTQTGGTVDMNVQRDQKVLFGDSTATLGTPVDLDTSSVAGLSSRCEGGGTSVDDNHISVRLTATDTLSFTTNTGTNQRTGRWEVVQWPEATDLVPYAPIPVERSAGGSSGATTTPTIDMPSTLEGRLVVFLGTNGPPSSFTWPDGWNVIIEETGSATSGLSVAYRDLDGTEGASIQVTLGTSQNYNWTWERILNAGGTPEATSASTTGASNPNPPSHTLVSGVAAPRLWLVGGALDNGTQNIGGAPTGYSNFSTHGPAQTGGTSPAVAHASRRLEVDTEDPGAFAGGADQWNAVTVIVAAPFRQSGAVGISGNASSYQTDPVVAQEGEWVVLGVNISGAGSPEVTAVSGTALGSMTRVHRAVDASTLIIEVWKAKVPAGGINEALTVTLSGNSNRCLLVPVVAHGMNDTDVIQGANVDSATSSAATSIQATLAAAQAGNSVLAFGSVNATGATPIFEPAYGVGLVQGPNENQKFGAAWLVRESDTTVDLGSDGVEALMVVVAMEIASVDGGGGGGGGVTLAVDDLFHGHSLVSPALTQANVLIVEDLGHAHTLDAPVLSVAVSLDINQLHHTHEVEEVALIQANLLNVQNLFHTHSVDSPVLSQANVLAPEPLFHAHNLDAPVLLQGYLLAPNPLFHGHSIESPELLLAGALQVDDLFHGHDLEGVTLVQANLLVVQDLNHLHTMDSPVLIPAFSLSPDNMRHAHTLESPTLSTADILVVADLSHLHSLDEPVLTQAHILDVQDLFHAHTIAVVGLVPEGWVPIEVARLDFNYVFVVKRDIAVVEKITRTFGF